MEILDGTRPGHLRFDPTALPLEERGRGVRMEFELVCRIASLSSSIGVTSTSLIDAYPATHQGTRDEGRCTKLKVFATLSTTAVRAADGY